jgi:hypothetical protein
MRAFVFQSITQIASLPTSIARLGFQLAGMTAPEVVLKRQASENEVA